MISNSHVNFELSTHKGELNGVSLSDSPSTNTNLKCKQNENYGENLKNLPIFVFKTEESYACNFPTILVDVNGKKYRAIIDNCSSISFASKYLVEKEKLKASNNVKNKSINVRTINGTKQYKFNCVNLKFTSIHDAKMVVEKDILVHDEDSIAIEMWEYHLDEYGHREQKDQYLTTINNLTNDELLSIISWMMEVIEGGNWD